MLFALLAQAQAGKKFTFFTGIDGKLFYVFPQKMDKAEGCVAKSKLKYDVTTLSTTDSISFTAFIVTPQYVQFGTATLTFADGSSLTSEIELLFVKPKGSKKYVNRVRFWVNREEFDKIVASPTPLLFDYGSNCTFKFSQKKWDKISHELKDIFEIMDKMK